MKGLFYPKETIDGKYMVGFNDDVYAAALELVSFEARVNFNILPARILGLSYAEYLRYLRDNYNGTIYGKNTYSPIAKFTNKLDCQKFCSDLTLRWSKI